MTLESSLNRVENSGQLTPSREKVNLEFLGCVGNPRFGETQTLHQRRWRLGCCRYRRNGKGPWVAVTSSDENTSFAKSRYRPARFLAGERACIACLPAV